MALHKMVDGVRVDLTPEEEAETLAMWKENEEQYRRIAHIESRRLEYPNLFEITEAIVDLMDSLDKALIEIGPLARSLLNKIKAIQQKHPKLD